VVLERAAAAGFRRLHDAVAADHEVHDELAADAGATVELVLVARAENTRARLHDAVDLLRGQAAEIALGIRQRDLHFLHAVAARRLRPVAAAPAFLPGFDLARRHEVALGLPAAAVAVALRAARGAGTDAFADARARAGPEPEVTALERVALDAGELVEARLE